MDKRTATVEFHNDVTIDAPACAAWHVLGEQFGEVAQWSGLDSSALIGDLGVGAARVCEGPAWGPFPASKTTEELVEFDRSAMRFRYVARGGLPWFIPAAQNHWRVEALSAGRCRVHSHARVELRWWLRPLSPLLGWAVRRPMIELFEQLSQAVRTRAIAHPC